METTHCGGGRGMGFGGGEGHAWHSEKWEVVLQNLHNLPDSCSGFRRRAVWTHVRA